MISPFPQVRNEESTYSIFSRLQFANQPSNIRIMGTILFNLNVEVGRLNFQGSFEYLCSNLPSKFTEENFLHNNTIFPLFIPFLSKEKQEKALEYFKGDYPDKMNRYLTIRNINNNKTYIRVCKYCIKEDFKIYGEPYYRRQHEIELNRICYKHEVPLYEYTISNYYLPKKYEDYYSVLSNSKEINIPEKFKEKLFDITADINTIFASNLDNWNIEITKNKIYNKFSETGYLTVTGVRLQLKFSKDFKKYYTEEFLDYIGYNFDVKSNSSWLRKITRKEPDDDPLKFILVIRYLFGNFKEFYKYKKKYSIFKIGPYPCLNRVCPNYNKLLIKDIMQINISKGYPVAIFKCEHCGFTYSRKGPDKNDNDIYTKTSVKDLGHMWHDKLKECVDKGLSIQKIHKILGGYYLRGISILVNEYKNPNMTKNPTIKFKYRFDCLLLSQYKNEVLSLIKQNPNTNRQDIFRLSPNAYKYLLENDNEWISNTIVPIKTNKKNTTIIKEEHIKNYWLNRDESLLIELLMAIKKIKSEKTPYLRITIYLLQRYVKYDNFNFHRDKLPKCFRIIDKVCETILTYQKRRINYVMKEMADNSVNITINKVISKANLRTRSNANQEALHYVEVMVKEHNHGNVIK